MKQKQLPLADKIREDEIALPEDLRKKLHGNYSEGEPTQVTTLIKELKKCAEETKRELSKAERKARQVRRISKRRASQPKLKLLLSEPTSPDAEEEST